MNIEHWIWKFQIFLLQISSGIITIKNREKWVVPMRIRLICIFASCNPSKKAVLNIQFGNVNCRGKIPLIMFSWHQRAWERAEDLVPLWPGGAGQGPPGRLRRERTLRKARRDRTIAKNPNPWTHNMIRKSDKNKTVWLYTFSKSKQHFTKNNVQGKTAYTPSSPKNIAPWSTLSFRQDISSGWTLKHHLIPGRA